MQEVAHEQMRNDAPFGGEDVSGIVGRHLIYRYANGWQYELYIKNATTIDYRIHSGMVGGRWVKGQTVLLVYLGQQRYKLSWSEPTGTSVSLAIDLGARRLHGSIFFPRWVVQHPERTVCFQNDHIEQMCRYRDAGPTYPIEMVNKFARIHFMETCRPDDESVISVAPSQLPAGYLEREN